MLPFYLLTYRQSKGKGKGNEIPVKAWTFQEVEAPIFHDNRHMKVVRFSAIRTGSIYPQEIEARSTPGP
jgi:hypothetical protein